MITYDLRLKDRVFLSIHCYHKDRDILVKTKVTNSSNVVEKEVLYQCSKKLAINLTIEDVSKNNQNTLITITENNVKKELQLLLDSKDTMSRRTRSILELNDCEITSA